MAFLWLKLYQKFRILQQFFAKTDDMGKITKLHECHLPSMTMMQPTIRPEYRAGTPSFQEISRKISRRSRSMIRFSSREM